MRGKLVFYGKPDEALAHVGAESFKDLYDKLEAPISERLARTNGNMSRQQAAEEVAEEWKRRFMTDRAIQEERCRSADRSIEYPRQVGAGEAANDVWRFAATMGNALASLSGSVGPRQV